MLYADYVQFTVTTTNEEAYRGQWELTKRPFKQIVEGLTDDIGQGSEFTLWVTEKMVMIFRVEEIVSVTAEFKRG